MGVHSKYIHLIRAMRKGDVLYLPETIQRLDRQIVASIGREGGRAQTACFVATNLEPLMAHRIVRIKMIEPMKAK
jgi:hypothetical protein